MDERLAERSGTEAPERVYMCVDLKSFYASVECIERGLDPMTTNLVVADPSRTKGTICLAVSPAMKKLGVPGRCRLFEIPDNIDYIIAPPRMAFYVEHSADIYEVYLHFFSKDDIHVYSIDEAFFDLTPYLDLYRKTPRELARMVLDEVLEKTGITAAVGLGPNLWLAKVALDIEAKHDSELIAELDEESYRSRLWNHTPLTDFWRIGPGTQRRLAELDIHTMGQVATAPEEKLYRALGIDAELLIDHAWGVEPTTIADIHAYVPKERCVTSGQVLGQDRTRDEGRLLIKEMADDISLTLVRRSSLATSIGIGVQKGKKEGLSYMRASCQLEHPTSSTRTIMHKIVELYDRLTEGTAEVHRLNIACGIIPEDGAQQLELLTDTDGDERDKALQEATIEIKRKFGADSLMKAMDLMEGATGIERNHQMGGHRSGI